MCFIREPPGMGQISEKARGRQGLEEAADRQFLLEVKALDIRSVGRRNNTRLLRGTKSAV